MENYHIPVLWKPILEYLPEKLDIFFDGTLGHGGHAEKILQYRADIEKYIGVDKDPKMLEKARGRLASFLNKLTFINDSYANIDKISNDLNVKFDAILLDLGVNMEHFKDATRGFSIKNDGPLDMRFDPKQYFKAEDLVNTYTKSQLSEIFQKYGDFSPRFSEFIADAIISARKKKKIQTTFGLKQILKDIRLNERKISVIFQTIRIEVNQELKELEIFLQKFVDYLNLGGRVFIISYHSIEDRLVKTYLKQLAKENRLKIITKHVIKPDFEEIKKNRAARSAKLRIAEKI